MGKFLTAIGTKKNGTIELFMSEEADPKASPFWIFNLSADDAENFANRLLAAAETVRRGVEDHDVKPREKSNGYYGQKSNNKKSRRTIK